MYKVYINNVVACCLQIAIFVMIILVKKLFGKINFILIFRRRFSQCNILKLDLKFKPLQFWTLKPKEGFK